MQPCNPEPLVECSNSEEDPAARGRRMRAKVKQGGRVAFDAGLIATGLNMTPDQTVKWFGDGRASSKIMEVNMSRVLKMECTMDDGPFDLFTGARDNPEQAWELRCITRRGARIAQSGMGGKRRKFNARLFHRWLATLTGFVFVDVKQFPNVAYWIVPIENIKSWVKNKKVSYKGNASRLQLQKCIDALPVCSSE